MGKKEQRFSSQVNIRNKKAGFEFLFLSKYVAGIQLTGTEIKSIREGKVNIQDAFCYFRNRELYVKQMHISPYTQGTHYNHVSDRERKLLLTKKELTRLNAKSQEKGLTIVPIRLFINERGFAKLEIALAKGKKLYDKRETIKVREAQKALEKINY